MAEVSLTTSTFLCSECKSSDFNLMKFSGDRLVIRCVQCGLAQTLPDAEGKANIVGRFTEPSFQTNG